MSWFNVVLLLLLSLASLMAQKFIKYLLLMLLSYPQLSFLTLRSWVLLKLPSMSLVVIGSPLVVSKSTCLAPMLLLKSLSPILLWPLNN
ncbi:hypothetical protein BC941DRAFT_255414 [Chlamydoabsidia padenii]|nr:hypothetical protein BC941DRAFT_255414 [Chlamydoabsidia padenii]